MTQQIHITLFLAILLLMLACSQPAQQNPSDWVQYSNARFGYCLQYPPDLLAPQGESENGDGQHFFSLNKNLQLTVYGSHNIDEETIEQELQFRIDYAAERGEKQTLHSRVLADTSYVIAGTVGVKRFREKVLLKDGIFLTIYAEYTEEATSLAESILKQSFDAFPSCFYKP